METATPQELDFLELTEYEQLPFRTRDPENPLEFPTITTVEATEQYATLSRGLFTLKKISLPLKEPGQGISQHEKESFLREARALRHA